MNDLMIDAITSPLMTFTPVVLACAIVLAYNLIP